MSFDPKASLCCLDLGKVKIQGPNPPRLSLIMTPANTLWRISYFYEGLSSVIFYYCLFYYLFVILLDTFYYYHNKDVNNSQAMGIPLDIPLVSL
jgi:hypothetical protein